MIKGKQANIKMTVIIQTWPICLCDNHLVVNKTLTPRAALNPRPTGLYP